MQNVKQNIREKMDHSKDLKAWLSRKFSLEIDEVEKVKSLLTEIIKSHGFKIIKETDLNEGVSIEGIYGSKIIKSLKNLIQKNLLQILSYRSLSIHWMGTNLQKRSISQKKMGLNGVGQYFLFLKYGLYGVKYGVRAFLQS